MELTEGDRLLNAGKVLFSDDIIQDVQLVIFATTERLTKYTTPVHFQKGLIRRILSIGQRDQFVETLRLPGFYIIRKILKALELD